MCVEVMQYYGADTTAQPSGYCQGYQERDPGRPSKLHIPLQVQLDLTLALEVGFKTSEKSITEELVKTVLSRSSTTWSRC